LEAKIMDTVVVVLSVGTDRTEEFEAGFREHELPIWTDLHARGTLVRASLTRMDITSHEVKGSAQYLIVAVFADSSGHHQHDADPRFQAWNERADEYQIANALAFGGETFIEMG
jgi:hypothetical protein